MKITFIAIVVGMCFGVGACNDDPRQRETADADSTRALNVSEQTLNAGIAVGQPARVPTEIEADSLAQLQQRIMQQPDNQALRRELGRRAIDANAGVVWTVGKGRINPKASTLNTALNQARMAATLDAHRWAAYLMEWHKTDYATNFGVVQANINGGKVVREAVNDSLCVVLVQAPLQQE